MWRANPKCSQAATTKPSCGGDNGGQRKFFPLSAKSSGRTDAHKSDRHRISGKSCKPQV
jgi:hypothetical protein